MDLNTLLTPNHLSVFSLGAYLGPNFTNEERKIASKKDEDLLSHFGIIPSEFDVPQCHCGRPMYPVTNVGRKLGYRYKCAGGHKKTPTFNTFIEHVHTSGELGCNKIIQMAYLWVLKSNAVIIQNEVNLFILNNEPFLYIFLYTYYKL